MNKMETILRAMDGFEQRQRWREMEREVARLRNRAARVRAVAGELPRHAPVRDGRVWKSDPRRVPPSA